MKKIIWPISLIVVLAVGLTVGYALGVKGKISSVGICVNQTTEKIKEKLIQAGSINEFTNSLSGPVLSVSGNEIKFEAQLVNPLQDEKLKNRTAVVTDKTKIYVYSFRSLSDRSKAAKDSADEVNQLQTQLATLDIDEKTCLNSEGVSSSSCQEKFKERQTIQQKLFQLQSLTEEYSMTEGTLSDIKSGWLITASVGRDEKLNSDGSLVQNLNIANELKFNAVIVEIREVPTKEIDNFSGSAPLSAPIK